MGERPSHTLDYLEQAATEEGKRDNAALCGETFLSHRTIPFCFVSGYGREHLPRNFADTPILAKPFASDTLLSTVRDILSKQVQQGLKSRL